MNKDNEIMPSEHKTILPRPCNGELFDDWTLDMWMLKVCEETAEAVTAAKELKKAPEQYQRFDESHSPKRSQMEKFLCDMMNFDIRDAYEQLCMELTDIITAATSALEYLGAGVAERQEYQRRVNDSNAQRDNGKRFRR